MERRTATVGHRKRFRRAILWNQCDRRTLCFASSASWDQRQNPIRRELPNRVDGLTVWNSPRNACLRVWLTQTSGKSRFLFSGIGYRPQYGMAFVALSQNLPSSSDKCRLGIFAAKATISCPRNAPARCAVIVSPRFPSLMAMGASPDLHYWS